MKSLTPAKLMILMVVVFACLVGAFIAKRLMAVEPVVKKAATRNIPLALADLPAGTVIKREHIGIGSWPSKEIAEDMFLSGNSVVGRIVKTGIKGNTPIRASTLYAFGELPPLKVSDKYQAVTIRLANSASLLDGLIKPGDFADIHFTLTTMLDDPRVRKLGGVSMTLFRGVRVMAVNQNFVQAPVQTSANSVTVEVPAESANLLLVAAGKGDISLTYTKSDDGISTVAVSDADRATLEELLNLPPIPEPPPPPPPPQPLKLDPAQTTMIYRRSNRYTNYFRDSQPVQTVYPPGYDTSINSLYGPGNNAPAANGPVNNAPGNSGPGNNQFRNINGNNDPNWNGGYQNGNGNGGYGNGAPGMPNSLPNPGQYGPGQFGSGQFGSGQYGPGQFGPGQYGPGQNISLPGSWNPSF